MGTLREIFKDHKRVQQQLTECIGELKGTNEILEQKIIEINKEIAETKAIVDKLKSCNNCRHNRFCLEDIRSKKIECVMKGFKMWEIWELNIEKGS